MSHIKLAYCAVLLALGVSWLISDPLIRLPFEFFATRSSFVGFSGVLAMGVMSVAMILSVRPVFFEPMLGGLDKMYRLHKWLGISGAVFSLVHLAWAQAPKWLPLSITGARPARTARTVESNTIARVLHEQRGLAEEVALFALVAMLVLVAAAMARRFPYRYFAMTHRLLAVVYLVLVGHSVVLLETKYWRAPIGVLMGTLMMAGSVAAFASIFRRVGAHRRAVAEITELVRHEDNRVLKVAMALRDPWSGHDAGQFAFLTLGDREGPHPFTISSSWTGDGTMSFLIKGLGDFTRALPDSLRVGDLVKVEGPYGRFLFNGVARRQIWIGGGIGVSPFIARMKTLALHPDGRDVDLFYSTREPDNAFIGEVREDALTSHVNFHLLIESQHGRLGVAEICTTVPDWRAADVWFCGPSAFGRAVRSGFVARGMKERAFHQELFDLR